MAARILPAAHHYSGSRVRKGGFDPVRLAAAGLALLAVAAVIGGSLSLRQTPMPPATGTRADMQPAAAVYVGQKGEAERAIALRHASAKATAAPAQAPVAAAKPAIDGKAVYDGGKEVIVDEISDKTLMEKISETAYQKYIYPRHFFGLPADAEIEATYFHFTNEDRSIVVTDPASGEDFLVSETVE